MSIRADTQYVKLAARGGHWLPPLNLGHLFNGPFLALYPTKKKGGMRLIIRKPYT